MRANHTTAMLTDRSDPDFVRVIELGGSEDDYQPPHQFKYASLQALALSIQTFIIVKNLVDQVYDDKSALNWFAFLTHWSLVITFLHESAMSFKAARALNNNADVRNLQYQNLTSLGLAVTTSVAATGLYWAFDGSGNLLDAVLDHGVDTAVLIGKAAVFHQSYVNGWRDVGLPLVVAGAYIGTNYLMVTQLGVPVTYNDLDWEKNLPKARMFAGIGLAAFAAIPAAYYLVRSCVKKLCCSSEQAEYSTALMPNVDLEADDAYEATPSQQVPSPVPSVSDDATSPPPSPIASSASSVSSGTSPILTSVSLLTPPSDSAELETAVANKKVTFTQEAIDRFTKWRKPAASTTAPVLVPATAQSQDKPRNGVV